VLVSAGGGAAGKMLLTTVLAARRAGCLAELPWLLLTGTNLPEEDFRALSNAALPQVSVERFRHDLPGLLRRCRVSVSQAGYNTVLDILRAGARAVLVPYEAERETEQLARAERLAELGAAELLRESELSPGHLAEAITVAASRLPRKLRLDTNGAERSAEFVAGLIGQASPAGASHAAR
jgi:predicted glycosyltransferase